MKGIYYYTDLKTNEIVYIGKDSNIDKNKRHKAHTAQWAYDDQQINRIIQNNPLRYEYKVLIKGDISEKLLNAYEMAFIRKYNPKFNFTIGGDSGFKLSEESKQKISESLKGRKISLQSKLKSSKTQNKLGYFRVRKTKCNTCKKGFRYIYSYYDENGDRKRISSVSLNSLKQKVLDNELEWYKLKEVI